MTKETKRIDPDVLESFEMWINDRYDEDRYDENGFLKPEYEDEYEDEEDEEEAEPFRFMGWFGDQDVSDDELEQENAKEDSEQ
jgi:hypothetical protein